MIAWSEIDSAFVHAGADAPGIGEIALFKPRQGNRHLGGGWRIQAVDAITEGAPAAVIDIFA